MERSPQGTSYPATGAAQPDSPGLKGRSSTSMHKPNLKVETNKVRIESANDLDLGAIDDRWSELKITGHNLEGRSYHSIVLYQHSLVTYGGYEVDRGVLEDFYRMKVLETDTFEWKKINVIDNGVKPGPRRRHSAVFYQDKMWLFGGQQSTTSNNNSLYAFDFTSRQWEHIAYKGTPPPPIDSHCCALYEIKNGDATAPRTAAYTAKMIVFGGFQGGEIGCSTNAVYQFDFATRTWEVLYAHNPKDKQAPPPRNTSGCCVDGDFLYIFGGCLSNENVKYGDLWKFDLSKRKWVGQLHPQDGVFPEARNGHSMVKYGQYIFVFGGIQDQTKEKNDIYAYSVVQLKWYRVHTNTNTIYARSPGKRGAQGQTSIDREGSQKRTGDRSPTRKSQSPQRKSKVLQLKSTYTNAADESALRSDGSPTKKDARGEDTQPINFMDEKKKQRMAEIKAKMLHDIECVPRSPTNRIPSSPTTEAMKNSLNRIGDQVQQRKKLGSSMGMEPGTTVASQHSEAAPPPPVFFKLGSSLLVGKKPCARDGQAACLVENKLLIFGGDRQLFSFNDVFFFDLDMAIDKHIAGAASSNNI